MSASLRGRLAQAASHLRFASGAIALPGEFSALARPGLEAYWSRLCRPDQRHLILVASALRNMGCSHDVIAAGLLHDLGKGLPDQTIGLIPRVLHVILGRFGWSALRRIGQRKPQIRLLQEVWTLIHHPRIGAEICQSLGYPDNVCSLVAAHADPNPVNPDNLLIQTIDDRS